MGIMDNLNPENLQNTDLPGNVDDQLRGQLDGEGGLAQKAGDLYDQHGERVDGTIDQAGDALNDRTGGRFGDQIQGAGDQIGERLDGLNGTNQQ